MEPHGFSAHFRNFIIQLLRIYAFIFRFKILPLAGKAFGETSNSSEMSRQFYGYKLSLNVSRSNIQKCLYLEGERFIEEADLLQDLIHPGMTIIDVGANIGYYTLIFARLSNEQSRILCFEPEPDNIVELERNINQNNLSNVVLRKEAVGAEDRTVSLARGMNGIVQEHVESDLTVPMVRLDSVMHEYVDMIKIDVEGYEGNVLLGTEGIIQKYRPCLFVEIHSWLLPTDQTVQGIFGFFSKYYKDIKVYERRVDNTLAQKFQSRYFGEGIVEIHDCAGLIDSCTKGERQSTFWAICKP